MHAEIPSLSPYETYASTELWQYEQASAGLLGTHELLKARALSELRGIRLFDNDNFDGWETYCGFIAQLPGFTSELMQAARYRIGGALQGQDAKIWTDAHNFVLDYGYVPATIGQASSLVITQAMHAGLDGVVFQKAYERSLQDVRPALAAGMSSYAANTLVALATDQALPDRLWREADRLSVGNFVRVVVGSQLSERTKGIGRAVVHAKVAAANAHPGPEYAMYLQGAAEQVEPYARAIEILDKVRDCLQPELRNILDQEALADVQETIELVNRLRERAWYRGESLSDSKIYEWLHTAWERTGSLTRLEERLGQTCQILYALMDGNAEGRLPF